MKLTEKVALITGGANGIGKTTAKKFLDEGAKVIISDVNEEAGEKTLNELSNYGEVIFCQADVANPDHVKVMVQEAIDTFGKIDILVNNAGITIDGRLTKMRDEDWQKVISVNLTGVFQ